MITATLISIYLAISGFFGYHDTNLGATILFPQGGGTGVGSVTAGDIGKVLAVSNNSPFTYTLTAAGSGTVTGTGTNGNCAQWTSATAIGDSGSPCGTGSGSGFSTTSTNFWYNAFKEWNLVGSYLTPTTTKGIIVASSTIGNGTDGLVIAGNSTTTGMAFVGPTNVATSINGPRSIGSFFGNFASICNGCGASSGNLLTVANFGTGATGVNTFSARGTADAPSATQSGDDIYFMGGRGFGSSVWNAGSKVAITMEASQAFTDTANGTRILLETTANNTTSRGERVRITGNGEVGIGTSTAYATTTIWGAGIGRVFEAVLGGLGINASTTLFFVGPGGATSTGLAATTLQNCDTIDTDANGNFKCGTDNSTAGSGSGTVSTSTVEAAGQAAFFTTNGASPALIAGDSGFTYNATDDRLTVVNASTTRLSINNWVVSTTTTVCAKDCEYTSIQGAINDGRNDIVLKDETYAGPVSITRSDFRMRGAGMYSSLITCDAGAVGSGVCVSVATSSRLTRIRLENFGVDNTNATKQGIGLDTSETSNVYASDIRITDFELGQLTGDNNKQETFYHAYYNMVYFDNNNCFRTASTTNAYTGNLANSHAMYSPRCRIDSASTYGVGYDIVGSEGWAFYSPDSEPASQVGTGFRVDGNSISVLVVNPWFENNATGTEIKSGALNTKIINGRITGNVTGVINAGTRSSFDGTLITANTTNVSDTSVLGTYFNTSSTYAGPFFGLGTSTAISANTRLGLGISTSNVLDPAFIINNAGAFATAFSGMMFQNSAGGFPDGVAKIGAEPGSGFTNAVLKFNVADSAKALQERMRITVNGWLGLGTSTPYAKLTVWGGSENTLLEVTNSASTTIFKAGLGGATTTGFAATSIPNCDTIDTDASGNFKCGTDASGGGAGVPDVILTGGYLRASSTGLAWLFPNGFVSQSSSTLFAFDAVNGTTTNATSTNLYVSGRLNLGSALSVANGGTGLTSLTATQIPYGLNSSQFSSEAAFNYDEGLNRLFVDSIFLKSANGVLLTIPANGKLSFTGQDGVNNEDLTLDLSSANAWNFTSSTGVATATFSGIGLVTTKASTTATSTLAGVMLTGVNCSGFTNSGKLTTNSIGEVICGNDTSGSGSSLPNVIVSGGYFQASTTGLAWLFPNGFVSQASSSVTNLSIINSTTTNATTTSLNVTTELKIGSISGILKGTSGIVSQAVNGVDYIGTLFRDWNIVGGSLTPTSTIGITVQASSTISGLQMANSTTTNATTTTALALSYLTSKILKTNSTGGIIGAIDGVDFLGPTLFRDWNITGGSLVPTSTIGITVQASSTIQGLTMSRSTTTNATTTSLNVLSELKVGSFSGLLKAVSGVVTTAIDGVDFLGPTNFINWKITGGSLVPTTTIGITVQAASSTINGLTINVSTTTSATTTNLNITGGLTFNGVTGATWAAFCTTITGSAGLCDGNDASGGGSFAGAPNALVASVDGTTLTSTSTPNFSAFNATSTTATSTIAGGLSVGSSTPDSGCFFCVGTTSPTFFVSKDGRVGFGQINNGPTRFTFGGGSNANLNPNIMFLVQDTADARFGAAVNNKFIGMKAGTAGVEIYGYDYTAGAAQDISMQSSFGGKVGIGTSTPWATLSVMPFSYNARVPLFTVATSTNATSTVFHVNATSTTLSVLQSIVSGGFMRNDYGSRVTIGSNTNSYDSLDHLEVFGRINSDWSYSSCDNPGAITAVSADGTACGGFYYAEDGAGGSLLSTNPTAGLIYASIIDTTAGGGAGFFTQGVNTGSYRIGTSTPVLETDFRINSPSNASTTRFYIGFTNVNISGTAFDSDPTLGCYFSASTTQANWQAVTRTSASATTQVDTGVASTTNQTLGAMRRFRVETDNNGCYFYIKSGASPYDPVARITTNIPNRTTNGDAVSAGVYYGRTNGGLSVGFDFGRFRIWWQDALGAYQ